MAKIVRPFEGTAGLVEGGTRATPRRKKKSPHGTTPYKRLVLIASSLLFLLGCATPASSPSTSLQIPSLLFIPPENSTSRGLTSEALQKDLSTLRYALLEGYAGFLETDAPHVRQALSALDRVDATNVAQLCAQLSTLLNRLPDNHLSVSHRQAGWCPVRRWRRPNVGANFGKEEGKRRRVPWVYREERLANTTRRLGMLAIGRFLPPDHPSWSGFEAALERLLEMDAVLIDLRGNGGGDDTRGLQLAAWLLGAEPRTWWTQAIQRQTVSALELQTNAYSLNAWAIRSEGGAPPPPSARILQLRRTLALAREGQVASVVVRDATPSIPGEPRFRGPVIILADAACASSCESTLSALRSHPQSLVIGEATRGLYAFGNVGSLMLPKSQMILSIPTLTFVSEDSATVEKHGLSPDVDAPKGCDALDVAREVLTRDTSPIP